MTESQISEFCRVVAEKVPANEGLPWAFADDDQWIDAIDNLDVDDVAQLWKADVGGSTNRQRVFDIVRDRVVAAMKDVQERFLKRDCAIQMMVASAIAQTNMVFLGRPGTAKSQIVRSFAQSLGMRPCNVPIAQESQEILKLAKQGEGASGAGRAGQRSQKRRFFEYLLTRYTTPEELFGGTDIQVLLKHGVFCRRTDGMLPQAEIAFLDEIFKANGAILNALLSLVNERIFYNMGRAFKVNMAFVVGASNETPDIAELGALYDRFPIRVPVFNVSDSEDDVQKLLNMAHRGECSERLHIVRDVGNRRTSRITRKACLNDIRLLSKFLLGSAYGGTTDFLETDTEFRKVFENLFVQARHDYGVSDRTPAQVLRVCRALAFLEKKERLEIPHLRAWGYVAPDLESLVSWQKQVEAIIVTKVKENSHPMSPCLFERV